MGVHANDHVIPERMAKTLNLGTEWTLRSVGPPPPKLGALGLGPFN